MATLTTGAIDDAHLPNVPGLVPFATTEQIEIEGEHR